MLITLLAAPALAADNTLTEKEKQQGWILLFDGRTLDGWMTSDSKPSKRTVDNHAINPHKSGHYMMVTKKQWENFILSIDFKISKGCNSGIFVRIHSLVSPPGLDVEYNGIEMAIDDTTSAGYHDTGAIFDLAKPEKNAMKPAGQWNRVLITCDENVIRINLNGQDVTDMDLDQFPEPHKRPDGSRHKFPYALKTFPRKGRIGLQDHGADCWFKNIKLRPLE